MQIGIDVGGTYTDAVLMQHGTVQSWVKVPTRPENIFGSLIEALDHILAVCHAQDIDRVTISTTLITNLIAEAKYEPVALMLLPGPGINLAQWDFHTYTNLLKGTIDFRGQLIEDLDRQEVDSAIDQIADQGFTKVAVVSKFSMRNPGLEQGIRERVQKKYPDWHVEVGHKVGGELNFPRRIASTLLTAATRDPFQDFAQAVTSAAAERSLNCPIYILKADGGTLPLTEAVKRPIETIFSGPAATVLGTMAMLPPEETAVVVDTGGTTTDLALILNGNPLLAAKGAQLGDYATQVRAFSVNSVPIGGDSTVEVEAGELVIRPYREGPAACNGGPKPTPTDALQILGFVSLGNAAWSQQAVGRLAEQMDLAVDVVAQQITDLFANKVQQAIDEMFTTWQAEPAYRLWELLQPDTQRPKKYIGVGGAGGIAVLAAQLADAKGIVPTYGSIANAVGAALASPTMTCSLRADTQLGTYQIEEDGSCGEIAYPDKFNLAQATTMAERWLQRRGRSLGIEVDLEELETLYQDVFNIIRGYSTVGRIFQLKLQTPRKIQRLSPEGGE